MGFINTFALACQACMQALKGNRTLALNIEDES